MYWRPPGSRNAARAMPSVNGVEPMDFSSMPKQEAEMKKDDKK
jgi:hypothetical protein